LWVFVNAQRNSAVNKIVVVTLHASEIPPILCVKQQLTQLIPGEEKTFCQITEYHM
jgi:hypothetical protein